MQKHPFIDCHCHLPPGVDDGSKTPALTEPAFRRLQREAGFLRGRALTAGKETEREEKIK